MADNEIYVSFEQEGDTLVTEFDQGTSVMPMNLTTGDTTYYIDNYYGNVDDTTYIKSGDTYTASVC